MSSSFFIGIALGVLALIVTILCYKCSACVKVLKWIKEMVWFGMFIGLAQTGIMPYLFACMTSLVNEGGFADDVQITNTASSIVTLLLIIAYLIWMERFMS